MPVHEEDTTCDVCGGKFTSERYGEGACQQCGTHYEYDEGLHPSNLGEVVGRYRARVGELEGLLRRVRYQLKAMNTSAAHAVSWVEPRTDATSKMITCIDAALAKGEA